MMVKINNIVSQLKNILTALTSNNKVKTATIVAGQYITGEIDLESYKYIGIIMPTTFTGNTLTFQSAATSGGSYQDINDDTGFEATVTVTQSKNTPIDLNSLKLSPWRYIKIRSGTASAPVTQSSERVITLVLKN